MNDIEKELLQTFSNILLNAEAQDAEALAFILDDGNAVLRIPLSLQRLIVLNDQYRNSLKQNALVPSSKAIIETYRLVNKLRWEDLRNAYWADPWSEQTLHLLTEIAESIVHSNSDSFPWPGRKNAIETLRDVISEELGLQR